MNFIEKNLSPNEKIIYQAKLHWWVYVKSILGLIVGIILIRSASSQQSTSAYLGAFLVLCALIGIITVFLSQKSSEFALTNKRVIFKTGLLSRKLVELQLNKAEGMLVEQSLLGRMFNFGKVKVTSGGVVEYFSPISDPFGFKKQVNHAIEGSFSNQSVPNI